MTFVSLSLYTFLFLCPGFSHFLFFSGHLLHWKIFFDGHFPWPDKSCWRVGDASFCCAGIPSGVQYAVSIHYSLSEFTSLRLSQRTPFSSELTSATDTFSTRLVCFFGTTWLLLNGHSSIQNMYDSQPLSFSNFTLSLACSLSPNFFHFLSVSLFLSLSFLIYQSLAPSNSSVTLF